jgi:transposase
MTIEPAAEVQAQPKRRRYSIAEKRRIVEESFEPKTSVARVARAHGVNANQVFSWRRLYQRGRLGDTAQATQSAELLPVRIAESPADAPPPAPARPTTSLTAGAIQLQLARGRLRIEGNVDVEALRLVLQCMLA